MITEEQRKKRMKGIGGSDMSIILGLSSYKTPFQLFLEKTGIIKGELEETNLQYWGNKLEPVILNEFSERNKVDITYPDTIVHPLFDFMRANLDGFIPEWNAVIEAKCSNSFMIKEWGEDGSDIMPMAYMVQLAHYVSCTNADGAYIAVLIGGYDYREFKYTRDLILENKIIGAANYFWEMVQNNIAPEPININDLKLLFPASKPDKSITYDNVSRETLEKLAQTKQKQKELAELESQYKFEIMNYMKDCEALIDENGKPIATWKANKKGTRTFLLKGL